MYHQASTDTTTAVLLGHSGDGFISCILDDVVLASHNSVPTTSHPLVLPLIIISCLLNVFGVQIVNSKNRLVDLEIAIGLNPSEFIGGESFGRVPKNLTEVRESMSAENFNLVQYGEWLGCVDDLINTIIGVVKEGQVETGTPGKSEMATIRTMELAMGLKSVSGSLIRMTDAGQKLVQVQIQIVRLPFISSKFANRR